jgi:DNA-binding XRE family transcriptional regulator
MRNPKKNNRSKVKEAREKRGWTQEYLSQITGLSRVYIHKLEKGDIPNPGIRNCKEIAYALGIKLEEI